MLRKLVFLCMMLLLAFVAFGARAVPDVIGDIGRADVSDEGSVPELADDSDSDIPTDPVEPMEEAVNIYIHVVLMLDEGPPPPSRISILNIESGYLVLKSAVEPSVLGGVAFNAYRRTNFPMYYTDDLVEFVGTSSRAFISHMYVGLDPDSVGYLNPDVNWFYVYTTVDGDDNESTYPSPNVCEFDQRVIKSNGMSTSRNFVSYPCDHGFETLLDVIDGYPDMENGVRKIERWLPEANNFNPVVTYVPFGGGRFLTSGDISISLGDVISIDFDRGDVDTTLFTTNVPGYLAPDRGYSFTSRDGGGVASHLIMMPMRYAYELALSVAPDDLNCVHVAQDIGEDYIMSLGEWNAFSQNVNNLATWLPFGSGRWVGDANVYPGKPYVVQVTADRPEVWPPTVTD